MTEKAFPEDEALWTTPSASKAKGSATRLVVYERRVGARHQWEATLTFGASSSEDGLSLEWRYRRHRSRMEELLSGIPRISILTAGGEVFFPTGRREAGPRERHDVFEPFLAFARVLPREWFFQAQGGAELPADSEKAEREFFWRGALAEASRREEVSGACGRRYSSFSEARAPASKRPTGASCPRCK